jgi:hypothetical protein
MISLSIRVPEVLSMSRTLFVIVMLGLPSLMSAQEIKVDQPGKIIVHEVVVYGRVQGAPRAS